MEIKYNPLSLLVSNSESRNRTIVIQGLLGSIQGNRLQFVKSNKGVDFQKATRMFSCILSYFASNKRKMTNGSGLYYTSPVNINLHFLKNSHWVR